MTIMTSAKFAKEFKYTVSRMHRLADHDLCEAYGNSWDRGMYKVWQSAAKKQLDGDFTERIHEVKRLWWGLCHVPSDLEGDMRIFRDRDARYSSLYYPSIDRADPSVAC